jgi:spore maturation protein CgeB
VEGFVGMKFAIFGLTISSSWGNGHATLWRGLCRSLSEGGHSIVFFERNVPYYAGTRDFHEMPGNGELVLYEDWQDVLARARREVTDADAAIISSYCPDAVAAGDLVVGSAALSVFYDLDTPVTLSRRARGEANFYIGPRGLADFDLVLSYTGGRALDALREELGARRVAPLYGHVDPDWHRPAEPRDVYRADLSYLGTYAEDRQAALNTFFLEPARRRPQLRFLIGGALYPQEFPWGANIYFVRHLPPGEHPAFFASSRATLNITRADMARMGWCPSGRLFEAASCGAPILSDGWDGLDAFFTPGEEFLVVNSSEDVLAALDTGDEALKTMAARARSRVLAEHTSKNRAEEFLAALEEARRAPRSVASQHVGAEA